MRYFSNISVAVLGIAEDYFKGSEASHIDLVHEKGHMFVSLETRPPLPHPPKKRHT
jgi:hypothetical protein